MRSTWGKNLLAAGLLLSGSFIHPTRFADTPDFEDFRKNAEVIQGYSQNKENNTYGVTLRVHESSVRSLATGIVHTTGKLRGYGRYIIIDHGHGWHSLYSNLARIDVARGDRIHRGRVLGQARHKRLFLVVSYRGNPINPSDVMREHSRTTLS